VQIRKYGRYWAVYDDQEVLVCVCVYRRGALEVVRRLEQSSCRVSKTFFETRVYECINNHPRARAGRDPALTPTMQT
jgi:hypothetical protein